LRLLEEVRLSHAAPAALAARYGLNAEMMTGLGGIDALTSAVIDR
jgi:hypothetical protein